MIDLVKRDGVEGIKAFIGQFEPMVETMEDGPQAQTLRYVLQELRKEIDGG